MSDDIPTEEEIPIEDEEDHDENIHDENADEEIDSDEVHPTKETDMITNLKAAGVAIIEEEEEEKK